MTHRMSIARLLVRRSVGLLILPVAIGLYAYGLADRGMPWRGDPAWGVEFVGINVMFVGTLVAAATAWQVAADRRNLASIINLTRRGHLHLPLRGMAVAAPVIALQLAVELLIVVLCLTASYPVPTLQWPPLVTPVLALLAAAAFGVLVGSVQHGAAAAAVAASAFLALGYLDYANILPLGLTEQGATGTMLGLRADPVVFGVRAVWLVAFGILCIVSAIPRPRRATGAQVISGLLVVGLALAPWLNRDSYRADPTAVAASVCAPAGQSQVCVIPPWKDQLPRIAALTSAMGRLMQQELGVSPAARFESWTAASPAGVNTIGVIDPEDASSLTPAVDVISDLVAPTGCPGWSDPAGAPPQTAFDGRSALTAWAAGQPQLRELGTSVAPAPALDAAHRAWFSSVARALGTCRLDAVPRPPGR